MKLPGKDNSTALVLTLVWGAFILVGGLSALQLRGDIHLSHQAGVILGGILAVFVTAKLLFLIHKAQVKK